MTDWMKTYAWSRKTSRERERDLMPDNHKCHNITRKTPNKSAKLEIMKPFFPFAWAREKISRNMHSDDNVELNVLGCRVDILGTNCDQCVCMVQCCFTSTETIRLIGDWSPGRPPRLSHSSRALRPPPAPRTINTEVVRSQAVQSNLCSWQTCSLNS